MSARPCPWQLGDGPGWPCPTQGQGGTGWDPPAWLCSAPGARAALGAPAIAAHRMWLDSCKTGIYGAPRTCEQELGVNQELFALPSNAGKMNAVESDCRLLGTAFAAQAELPFAVRAFPVPAAAPFPSRMLSPLSCHRSHPVTLGTVGLGAAPGCSSPSAPAETPWAAGRMPQRGTPQSLSPPGLEGCSCVLWGAPSPAQPHQLPRDPQGSSSAPRSPLTALNYL